MELLDTVELMSSTDYKQRFKAEYYQLNTRLENLNRTIVKAIANTLGFELSCDIKLLQEQSYAMTQYLRCLEIRAEIEGIEL